MKLIYKFLLISDLVIFSINDIAAESAKEKCENAGKKWVCVPDALVYDGCCY